MNRIYQGRANRLELIEPTKKDPKVLATFDPQALTKQTNPLWKHHEIFQDAVNYYLVALAALARGSNASVENQSENERLAADLLARIKESWTTFRGSRDARHLQKSLSETLKTEVTTPDEAFDLILAGNETARPVLRLALQLLLNRISGDIQKSSKTYLPHFTVAQTENEKLYSGSFEFDATGEKSRQGLDQLSEILHSESSEQELSDLALKMDISWAKIKCESGKIMAGKALKERISLALSHQAKRFSQVELSRSESEFLEKFSTAVSDLECLHGTVESISDKVQLPVNKGGNINWDLVHSAYLFKMFPSRLTAGILALSVKKPISSENTKTKNDEPDYLSFGDDPIKLSRGHRGLVFPAFTALQYWNPKNMGIPSWKQFDIAAFAEALKSLNQFNQKTTERAENSAYLKGKVAILLGSAAPGWKARKTEDGEAEAKPEPLESSLLKLTWQVEDELTAQLADTVVGAEARNLLFGDTGIYPHRSGQWRISTASLRGFRDIAEQWNKLLEDHGADSLTSEQLMTVVKDYQRAEKNKKQVGSLPLLLLLCEKAYWPLWQKDHDRKQEDEPTYNRFLYQVIALHQSVRDWQRAQEPINLTPAEPRHSRRLYMFSDITGSEKVVFKEEGIFETTLAYEAEGQLQKHRARIHYTAPRLHRDQLLGGEESRWLQPMTQALGLSLPEPEKKFESAVSLMPDFDREGNTRFLLNFPKKLDETWLKNQIGREAIWRGQFNGVKDKNLHLHWPQNEPKTTQAKSNPWWENEAVIAQGFTTLSVDLGQRTAGAWALLKVTCGEQPDHNKPCRSIGHDGEREWFATVERTGMLRLPGEDQKVIRRQHDEQGSPIKGTREKARELAGSAGRNADSAEYEQARELAKALGANHQEDSATNWVGRDRKEKSYPQQNDSLLALANRRLSRLGTYHRWSCIAARCQDSPEQAERLLKALQDELEHWQDPEVVEWKATFSEKGIEAFGQAAGERFVSYREELKGILLTLADRTAPLRGKKWVWETRPKNNEDDPDYGLLIWEREKGSKAPKVRGQRGLSMERLEQLETLRKLFLRFNRSLDKQPGKPSKVGFGFSHDSGEPAELLLGKIDRMKEQRVNQTAHLILAQALGVQLRTAKTSHDDRRKGDIHGEYEPIRDRAPVDFVVIENLDRYLTSQGRAPSENRRLMKWAHRAVRDKLKMLAEEPFGIPVVEAPAAYSSRFCARTSQPGSRCWEKHSLDNWLTEQLSKKAVTAPPKGREDTRPCYHELIEQFAELAELNRLRQLNKQKPHTLLLPRVGGPLFCPAISGSITQADANAAINIGLRALAAPEALHLIHKVRSERKKEEFKPVLKNAREKATFDTTSTITPVTTFSDKVSKAPKPNFFHLAEEARGKFGFDQAQLQTKKRTQAIVSGVAFHTVTDDLVLKRIVELNRERLANWGDDIPK